MSENVAILGASNKSERYSYKALVMLTEYGHTPYPIHPKLTEIEGHPVFPSLIMLQENEITVNTLTMYIRPELSTPLLPDILQLSPQRVIFNPGTENPKLQSHLQEAGIETVEACTLVMLRTGQF